MGILTCLGAAALLLGGRLTASFFGFAQPYLLVHIAQLVAVHDMILQCYNVLAALDPARFASRMLLVVIQRVELPYRTGLTTPFSAHADGTDARWHGADAKISTVNPVAQE